MGKKKKLLLEYFRTGKIKKKLEKKFSSFIKENMHLFGGATAEPDEAKEEKNDSTPEKVAEKPKTAKKPKTSVKKAPATKKKTTTTTRRKRTTKAKTND